MADTQTLYERLGGRDAIAAAVDRFYDRVLEDERLSAYFEDADVEALRGHQTRFLSSVAGGPVEYDGRDVKTAHEGLEITDDAFDAVATHLDETLREFDVADDARSAVLEAVGGLREDVVSA